MPKPTLRTSRHQSQLVWRLAAGRTNGPPRFFVATRSARYALLAFGLHWGFATTHFCRSGYELKACRKAGKSLSCGFAVSRTNGYAKRGIASYPEWQKCAAGSWRYVPKAKSVPISHPISFIEICPVGSFRSEQVGSEFSACRKHLLVGFSPARGDDCLELGDKDVELVVVDENVGG